MSDALPFTLENLAGAAARPLLAPATAPLPAKLSDITAQRRPYAATTPWFDVGATGGPLQVSRNITVAGYTIQQSQTPLLEEPTEVTYTVQIPFAELRPETIQIINQSNRVIAAVASATDGSGKKIPFGNITDLAHYRVAFLVRRVRAQGVVDEGGGVTRGRYLAYVGYDCTITGENVQTNFGRGELSQAPVTFRLYPDPTGTVTAEGEEHGFFFDEDDQIMIAA